VSGDSVSNVDSALGQLALRSHVSPPSGLLIGQGVFPPHRRFGRGRPDCGAPRMAAASR